MNLITNASEALDGGEGEVSIRTGAIEARADAEGPEHAAAQIFLEVADTGSGMDRETKSKIFDPFFTTKFTGRGLGLAAVQGIVRAHAGAIRVDTQPRRGTTFTVMFPPSSRRASPVLEAPTTTPALGGAGTILVIDDEDNVRNVARAALEDAGYTVLLARDGHEAIETFDARAAEIDAVLLDLSMPRMSGEETLTALRKRRPEPRVVLTSGYSEDEISAKFEGKGLAGFVHKPFRASELVDKIHAVLADADPSESARAPMNL
jgi:CheY-like chemotaxis protein